MTEVLFVLLGWALGLFTAPITGALNRPRERRELATALNVELAAPAILSIEISGELGNANYSVFVPAAAQGLGIHLQAVDMAACAKTNLISHVFR